MKKMTFIRNIDAFFLKKARRFNSKSSVPLKILSHLGSFSVTEIITVVIFFLPFTNAKFLSLLCFVSIIVDTIIVFVIKYTCRRKRPVTPKSIKYVFDPYSFPSGHVSRLTVMCTAAYSSLPAAIVFFVLMILCLTARVLCKYHYFTDCLAGIITGIPAGVLTLWLTAKSIIPLRYILYMFGF